MKLIISPAKRMVEELDFLPPEDLPRFLDRAETLRDRLAGLSLEELRALLGCNEQIAQLNHARYARMDLRHRLTPAVFAYQGLQYQYMAPKLFTYGQYGWLREHLRILSGLYGILRPFDGVVPYRLEMGAKYRPWGLNGLYAFWGDSLARALAEEDGVVVDLASREYSRAVLPHLPRGVRVLSCRFGQWDGEKLREAGSRCKMARGEMVRWLAEQGADRPEALRDFDRLDYRYRPELSREGELVFVAP